MSKKSGLTNLEELDTATRDYYSDYYLNRLGLPDWKQKVETRLNEDLLSSESSLSLIEKWLNYSFDNKRVLVVGAGTGGETFAFHSRGANVVAVEPDSSAIKIISAKARLKYNICNPALQAAGEALPFRNCHFDFIYCYTVLEHVKSPVRCIDEMIRIVKPNGWIFIETPDYRQFYEPHYKVTMPMFAPKWMLRLWLRFIRRPVEFFDSLQFINSKNLRKIFQNRPVTAFQIIHSWPKSWFSKPNIQTRLAKWVAETFGVQRDQWWLLQKLKQRR